MWQKVNEIWRWVRMVWGLLGHEGHEPLPSYSPTRNARSRPIPPWVVAVENAGGKRHQFEDVSGKILEAALEVHRTLGAHFQELTYQRALALEFERQRLHFGREEKIPIFYRGQRLLVWTSL